MNNLSFANDAKSSPLRFRRVIVSACACLSLLTSSLHAGPVPGNLGSGLDALVEANVKLQQAKKEGTASQIKLHNGYATKKAGNIAPFVIKDEAERILVRVQLNGIKPFNEVAHKAQEKVPAMKMVASDRTYHQAGVFEAHVPLDDVPKLAGLEGVAGVFLTPRPMHARLRERLSDRLANRNPSGEIIPQALTGEKLNLIGTVFDFGVTQHRVDQINQTYNPDAPVDYEGQGISIGDLSDSFDTSVTSTSTSKDNAAADVLSGDLPGAATSTVNTTPVYVLQDFTGGTDEGRGMCQTLFKMAPKATLAFATADVGELGFAQNIQKLANVAGSGFTNSAGFKADVIVDDVSYLDEPFFQDGIIAQGVNAVVANGVSYFSSAANNPGTNGYDADFNFVSATNVVGGTTTAPTITLPSGLVLSLTGVPTEAYAGGFHNFAGAGAPVTVGQLVNFPNSAELLNYTDPAIPNLPLPVPIVDPVANELPGLPVVLQWNDPDNVTTPSYNTPAMYTETGEANTATSLIPAAAPSFTQALTAGQEYYFVLQPAAAAFIPGTSPLDGQITIADSTGTVLSFTDNNGSGAPEMALFFPPGAAGTTANYTITVNAFQSAAAMDLTSGDFTLYTYTANGTDQMTQNLNLLVFDSVTGGYISGDSVTTNGIASGSPVKFTEFVSPPDETQLIFVISRSTPVATSGRTANHFRYLCFGDGITPLGPAQFFSYTTPLTFGHSSAAGANSVAAYPYYKPNIPEFFTSPGPSTVYFDANNNYIGKTVRLKPDVAAMDGANTTFFGVDDGEDADSSDNFFGTSDAAPHAAAIAALVLQAHGGPRSVSPAQMKSILQASAFPHDLDPYRATGTARTTDGGKVNIIIKGDDEDSQITGTLGATGTVGIEDPNGFTVQYTGPGTLTSLVFNPESTDATGGNVTDGVNGLTVPTTVTATVPSTSTYFNMITPGIIWDTSGTDGVGKAFTPGTSSTGVTATSTVSANNFTLSLLFTGFAGGDIYRFGIGREEYLSAMVSTAGASSGTAVANGSADIFGGGVSIPDGAIDTQVGMTFSGTTLNGTTVGTFGFNPNQTSPAADGQTAYIRNKIGKGYSALDGFGFINAEAACGVTSPDVGVTAGLKKQPAKAQ